MRVRKFVAYWKFLIGTFGSESDRKIDWIWNFKAKFSAFFVIAASRNTNSCQENPSF